MYLNIKTVLKKANIIKNKKPSLNFDIVNKPKNFSENNVDKILYRIYFDYYKKENEDLQNEVIETFVNVGDSTLLLNNRNLHTLFINEINEFYKKDFITTYEELDTKYALTDFKNLELAFHSRTKSELPEELRENRIALKEKYEICRKEMILPLIRKSDGKKILGVMRPSINISKIRHHDIVFLTSDIIAQNYMIKGLSFLENTIESTQEEMNPNELLNMTLKFMIDKNYSDLQMYLFNSQYYEIAAEKNGVNSVIASNVSFFTAKKLTEALLRRIEEDVKSIKPDISKKLTYQSPIETRFFRVQLLAQSKTGMNSTYMHRTVNLRLLGENKLIKNFSTLGFPPKVQDLIKTSLTSSSYGFYFITGPTGKGKTTTLYSMLVLLHTYNKEVFNKITKIMTIDNPLEYDIDGFISIDLQDTKGTERELSVNDVISAFLRSNPDIVCLTEMRGEKEFEAFFRIGLRGHPAFGTLHANNVLASIQLLESMTPPSITNLEIRSNLRLIISMDLIPKKCNCCDGKGYINDNEKESCEACEGGIIGKIPIFELVYFNQKGEGSKGFDAKEDDIYDFEKLKQEEKIVWVKKSDIAESLYRDGIIFKHDYEKFSGKAQLELINDFKNGIL